MSQIDLLNLPTSPLPTPYANLHVYANQVNSSDRRGGEGAVYRVCDTTTNQVRALKLFKRDRLNHPRSLRSQLDFCQNLPTEWFTRFHQVIDLHQTPQWECVGFTMDYLDVSFKELLELACCHRWKFPTEVVERWIRELASAVNYLMEHGRVHRDLKPGNIGFRLPPTTGAINDLFPSHPLPVLGDSRDDFLRARLVLTDLGTLANVGEGCNLVIRANNKYLHRNLYTNPQVARSAMDLYAFAGLLEDFQSLTDGPTEWLKDARERCRDIDDPVSVGVLPRLVSASWKTQSAYRDAGFEDQGLDEFVGRKWVFRCFDLFRDNRRHKDKSTGGVFLVIGPAGSGKSMLLRRWSNQEAQYRGYYFKVSVRTTAKEMVESICRQLDELYRELWGKDQIPEEESNKLHNIRQHTDYKCRLQHYVDLITHRPNAPRQLLVFVDALDETANAGEAQEVVESLPARLPSDWYLILSARPEIPGWNYRQKIRERWSNEDLKECVIDLTSDDNKKDVIGYLATQLKRKEDDGQILTLADRCAYIFLLANFQVLGIRRNLFTLEQALQEALDWSQVDSDQRLSKYYRSTWDRITGVRDRGRMVDLLSGISTEMVTQYVQAMLAVLGEHGIDEECLFDWLKPNGSSWTAVTQVRTLNQLFLWFVESARSVVPNGTNPSYRVRHKSIRDFLTAKDGPIPLADVRTWHRRIAEYYKRQAGYPNERKWDDLHPYGKPHLVRHLLECVQPNPGNPEKLQDDQPWREATDILTDWKYLMACLSERSERV